MQSANYELWGDMVPELLLIFLSEFAPMALGANGRWAMLVAANRVDGRPDPRFAARRMLLSKGTAGSSNAP